jgi:alkylation response protein AidB-like acyl-CoA dehydrogenase
MDSSSTEEQVFFRDTTRRFLDTNCPIAKVRELADEPAGFDRKWWSSAGQLGWFSLLVDEQHGGAGLGSEGALYLAIVAEEMGRLVTPGPVLPTSIVAAALSRSGTPAQQVEVLPGLLTGDIIGAWCLAEGAGRSQPADVGLAAVDVEGGFRVSGVKQPIEGAADADVLLVTAQREGRPIQFLLSADTPGIRIERMDGLDLVRRFGRVTFDDVIVANDAIVGNDGDVEAEVEFQFQLALALQSAESAGAAERVFEFTHEWMFDRYSFGRPLASYQALKHRFADMKTWMEACQATAWAAVSAVAEASPQGCLLARVAKAYVSDRAPEIVQDCVQMHGGIGVTWDHDIHLYLRRVATNRMVLGTLSEAREAVAQRIPSQVGESQ